MPNLVNHLILLTQYRDRDRINRALVNGLVEMLQPVHLTLYGVALEAGKPMFGRVLSEIALTEAATTARATGSALSVGYEPARPDDPDAQLTMRETAASPRVLIPRERWHFGRKLGGRAIYDPSIITLETGFKPGAICDEVCEVAIGCSWNNCGS
jgi:hypothetical protein